jgi:hypothetical protein
MLKWGWKPYAIELQVSEYSRGVCIYLPDLMISLIEFRMSDNQPRRKNDNNNNAHPARDY